MSARKRRSWGRLNVYANLSARRRSKLDALARRKAEYLASLPKQPLKRLLYRLRPKQFFHYWFSRQGAMMLLKLLGIGFVLFAIFIAALFAYYRHELDAIRPSELANRVQTTVTRYYDRNGVLLWEDKGDGDYKLVVDSKDISPYMKNATVAIEDKGFYSEPGVSIPAIIRAALSHGTQGGSTLTQQLVKNVFFSSNLRDRTISRKIKEAILALEVERMYNKDQILTLYLNEVPYGGRRNGVESAAQTYFGKSAKDLTVAEAALLASIPQEPELYNPYNIEGNSALIARQHTVIDKMAEQGYITKQQADDAKKVAILDTIKPELSSTENILAPHFVLQVRSALEQQFGQQVVRGGGLTVKTTLDYRLQQIAEKAVTDAYNKYIATGRGNAADNIAFSSVDVPTGQVLAMVGSYNFNDPNYGALNAANALLQPGSSIKIADYSQLFTQRSGQNFGAGSVLEDKDISNIYGAKLENYNGQFFGPMTVREAFANSRNPPAVEAAYISGMNNVINLARAMGDVSYCVGENAGLSAAIGGCHVREVEHVNAYATLARGGVYEPLSYVLDVKNAQGQSLTQWKDQPKRVLDPQIPYIISDILTDPHARSRVFGPNPVGMSIPGVKTSTKTGTTDDGHGHAKDNWMMSYTPRVAAGVWVGRHDGKPLTSISTPVTGAVINDYMSRAHKEIFAKDGSWKPSDWFSRPAGVQTLTVDGHTDLFPSWYNKPKSAEGQQIVFDRVSKKKATNCTPDRAKQTITVQSTQDPITGQTSLISPDGYDVNSDDDAHKCDDAKPFASIDTQDMGNGKYHIAVTVNQGTFGLQSIDISVDGQVISSQSISAPGTYGTDYTATGSGDKTISVTVIDQGWYDATVTKALTVTLPPTSGPPDQKPPGNGGEGNGNGPPFH